MPLAQGGACLRGAPPPSALRPCGQHKQIIFEEKEEKLKQKYIELSK